MKLHTASLTSHISGPHWPYRIDEPPKISLLSGVLAAWIGGSSPLSRRGHSLNEYLNLQHRHASQGRLSARLVLAQFWHK